MQDFPTPELPISNNLNKKSLFERLEVISETITNHSRDLTYS